MNNPTQFHPKAIGTYFHHWLVDIQKTKYVPYIKRAFTNLDSLMTVKSKGRNLLSMTKELAQNDFSNIELFESYEVDHESMISCVGHFAKLQENWMATFNSEEIIVKFIKQSPCISKTVHPYCKKYCQDLNEVSHQLSKKQKLALMR